MSTIFSFGERIDGYNYKVINEREARASAGIMFLFGIISLFTVFGMRTLFWAELFSITFIVEFFIRVVINPRYAPYMVLGSLFVSNQQPEWVEAKPKKFAWILGAILGAIMAYFIIANIVSPVRMLACVLCLILLFTESAFGICLGCMLYNKFNVPMEGNCPGGVCETVPAREGQGGMTRWMIVLGFVGMVWGTFVVLTEYKYSSHASTSKMIAAKMEASASMVPIPNKATPAQTMQQAPVKVVEKTAPTETKKSAKDCEVPGWAIKMGHREMWLKHNGCT